VTVVAETQILAPVVADRAHRCLLGADPGEGLPGSFVARTASSSSVLPPRGSAVAMQPSDLDPRRGVDLRLIACILDLDPRDAARARRKPFKHARHDPKCAPSVTLAAQPDATPG
jgi:hypothetical protein